MHILTKTDFIVKPNSTIYLKVEEIILDGLMLNLKSSATIQYYFAEVDGVIFIREENLVTSAIEIMVIKTASDYVLKMSD